MVTIIPRYAGASPDANAETSASTSTSWDEGRTVSTGACVIAGAAEPPQPIQNKTIHQQRMAASVSQASARLGTGFAIGGHVSERDPRKCPYPMRRPTPLATVSAILAPLVAICLFVGCAPAEDEVQLLFAADSERGHELLVPDPMPDGPLPLVVLLHGLGGQTGKYSAHQYLQATDFANVHQALVVIPEATTNSKGAGFWNATDVCCDFEKSGVDDSAFIADTVATIKRDHEVDAKRVYAVGHSNGGFMAHRLACDHADLFAAVVSVNGATFKDRTACRPTHPVSVLSIHASGDRIVTFTGGDFRDVAGKFRYRNVDSAGKYPGAIESSDHWATLNKCTGPTKRVGSLDLTTTRGDDAQSTRTEGCPDGIAVDLWAVDCKHHAPRFSHFAADVFKWLQAHPKP